MTSISPIAPTLKKKPKCRVKDEATTLQLQAIIDDMIKYRAAYSFKAKLRTSYSLPSTLTKNHLNEVLSGKDSSSRASTNYGDVNIAAIRKTAHTISVYKEIVDELGLDKLGLGVRGDAKCKYTLKVETSALNELPEVQKRSGELIEELGKRLEAYELDTSDGVVHDEYYHNIAPRLSMAKEIFNDAVKYLHAYNRLRDLFTKVSTKGTYPRMFSYRGVVLMWQDIFTVGGYVPMVKAFIQQKDLEDKSTLSEQFKEKITAIAERENLITHVFLLDDYDYYGDD